MAFDYMHAMQARALYLAMIEMAEAKARHRQDQDSAASEVKQPGLWAKLTNLLTTSRTVEAPASRKTVARR